MKTTQKLHEIGHSLWLDNITRGLLASGTLQRYILELSITGLTLNPTIFDHAIKNSRDYDDAISQKMKGGKSGKFFLRTVGKPRRHSSPAQSGTCAEVPQDIQAALSLSSEMGSVDVLRQRSGS